MMSDECAKPPPERKRADKEALERQKAEKALAALDGEE